MVVGLDIKYSVMLIPVTMFFYLTAIMNPIIELKCVGPNCRKRMHSKFDKNFSRFDSYEEWRNGSESLQSDGNVTLIRFSHGYVKCDSDCDDCEGKDGASETCTNYNDTEYQLLLDGMENLTESVIGFNHTLPTYLEPNCNCRDWCTNCDDYDLVSLPGDEDGLHRHMQNFWNKLQTNCKAWEMEFGSSDGEMCKLFERFYFTMALTVIGFVWLGAVLVLMMFMEYTNFHIFNDGKCKCCFRTPRFKKILFTVLLTAPVSFMMYIGLKLMYVGNTEELLDKYFELVGAEFEYDWDTRGVTMFWISMALALLSIVVMMLTGTTQRHLRTIINYRRGVEYNGVSWKPHMS